MILCALVLICRPAAAAAQPAAPCGACIAVSIAPGQAGWLPPAMTGVDLFLRVDANADEAAIAAALARIHASGARAGIIVSSGRLPALTSWQGVAQAILRVDLAGADAQTLAFELKTALTTLRATLPAGVRVGLAGEPDALARAAAADVGPYVDFVVGSALQAPASVPMWLERGTLTSIAAALTDRPPAAPRTLWRAPDDEAAAASLLRDLAVAAAALPEQLVPASDASVACDERQASVWLDPATLERVAWLPGCRSGDAIRIAPAGRIAPQALAEGLIVRIAADPGEGFAEGVDVRASRELTIGEIIARHQTAAERQRAFVRTLISVGSLTLTFEAPGLPAPVTISSQTVIYTGDGRTDIEQRHVRVNGLEYPDRGIPRLPIIEPERVASLPLTITLTDVYRYSLAGRETLDGTLCYVVAFEPRDRRAAAFAGRAWIAADTFGLARVAAAQTGLRGPIVSSEQVDQFRREAGDLWLLARSEVRQLYEGAAHRTPLHRVLAVERHEINTAAFGERRETAYASGSLMMRDTPQGYRYLRRDRPAGDRAAADVAAVPQLADRSRRIRTVAAGVIVDPNISRPLPFAGISYVDFDLFGTGAQFNGFFGGTYGQLAWSVPSLAGSRWQLGGRAFGLASSYNDRAFVGGLERYEQNIRQRPAHGSAWLLRPLSTRVTLRSGYELDYTHYSRADSTDAAFRLPADQVVHGFRLAIEGQRAGWTGSAWWNPAYRSGWRPWGFEAADDGSAEAGFQRYGASIARSMVFRPSLVARTEAVWMASRDLDRFSRYTFGTFDNRLRGYPSALIRYDRGGVLRNAVAWAAARFVRVDGFVDSAWVHDPGIGGGLRNYTGLGLALEAPLPLGGIAAIEWGYGIHGVRSAGGRGTHVVRISGFKVF